MTFSEIPLFILKDYLYYISDKIIDCENANEENCDDLLKFPVYHKKEDGSLNFLNLQLDEIIIDKEILALEVSYPWFVDRQNDSRFLFKLEVSINEFPEYEEGDEIFIRKDSDFYQWVKDNYNKYKEYVKIEKPYLYLGKILTYDDRKVYIEYYSMFNFVIDALPEYNRTDRLRKLFEIEFDQTYSKIYNKMKNILSLRDPKEIDFDLLPYILKNFNVDIDISDLVSQDDPNYWEFIKRQRVFAENLPILLKKKGTYAYLYAVWLLLTDNTKNKLRVFDRFINRDIFDSDSKKDLFNIVRSLETDDINELLSFDHFDGENIIKDGKTIPLDTYLKYVEQNKNKDFYDISDYFEDVQYNLQYTTEDFNSKHNLGGKVFVPYLQSENLWNKVISGSKGNSSSNKYGKFPFLHLDTYPTQHASEFNLEKFIPHLQPPYIFSSYDENDELSLADVTVKEDRLEINNIDAEGYIVITTDNSEITEYPLGDIDIATPRYRMTTFLDEFGNSLSPKDAIHQDNIDIELSLPTTGTINITNSELNFSKLDLDNIWTLRHGLDHKYVIVRFFDDFWNQIYPTTFRLIDNNNCEAYFAKPQKGYMLLKKGEKIDFSNRIMTPHYRTEMDLSFEPLMKNDTENGAVIDKTASTLLNELFKIGQAVNRTHHKSILLSPISNVKKEKVALYKGYTQNNIFTKSTVNVDFNKGKYNYLQEEPKDKWIIQHNLGTTNTKENVYVYKDGFYKEIIPKNIKNIDVNTVEIEFSKPVIGTVNITRLHQFETGNDLIIENIPASDWKITSFKTIKDKTISSNVIPFSSDVENNNVIFSLGKPVKENYIYGYVNGEYKQVFTEPLLTWNISHNLNLDSVICQCFNDDGKRIFPNNIEIIDSNNIKVNFSRAISGEAVIANIGDFTSELNIKYFEIGEGNNQNHINNIDIHSELQNTIYRDEIKSIYEDEHNYLIYCSIPVDAKVNTFAIQNSYFFKQQEESLEWIINHKLETINTIEKIYDNEGKEIIPLSIENLNENNIKITFFIPTRGYVLITKATNFKTTFDRLRIEGSNTDPIKSIAVSKEKNQTFYPLSINGRTLNDMVFTSDITQCVKFNFNKTPSDYIVLQDVISDNDTIYTQSTPDTVWDIQHNLGVDGVIVSCYDHNNEKIIPKNGYRIDSNTYRVEFSEDVSGQAVIINVGNHGRQGRISRDDQYELLQSKLNELNIYEIGLFNSFNELIYYTQSSLIYKAKDTSIDLVFRISKHPTDIISDFEIITTGEIFAEETKVVFNNLSTPDDNIEYYEWDFGDKSTSILKNPTHTFQYPGTYTVSLTVYSPDGYNTSTKEINVSKF